MGGMLEGMAQTAFWMPVSEKAGTLCGRGLPGFASPSPLMQGFPLHLPAVLGTAQAKAACDAHSTPHTPRQKQRWPALTP